MIKRAEKKCFSFSYEDNKKYKEIQWWEPKPYNIHARNVTFFKTKYNIGKVYQDLQKILRYYKF